MVIVPGSVFLLFDLTVSGHENNTVVNNISRNLVKRQRVVFGGESLQDTMNYDLFQTYHDLFLPKEERENMLRHGISSENMRKLRTNAGDKDTSNAKEVALATLHNTKYCIPLDHPILTDHGVFCPKSLSHPLKFEIKLAAVPDVVVFSDTTKPPTYKITNLELEYRCISSKYLADQAQAAYKTNHAFFYENILHHKTFTFSKPNDSVINEHINVPRRSMTGILFLFTENPTAGERGSEKFVNPDIKSVKINIDGVPNMLYSEEMLPTDQWESIKQRFPRSLESEVTETKFYTEDKFALWIDLRSHADNEIHGSGLALKDTRDGVKLEIRRKVGGSGNITCDMFIVADALMENKNSNLNSILYLARNRRLLDVSKMEELQDKTPFHCIITGPTNCGKTRYVIDQLRGPFLHVFEWIVLICPTYSKNKTYRGFAKGDKRFVVLSPDASNVEEINDLLGICEDFFSGTNTLIILDDCAVSRDLKNRTNKFINLAFSGRHAGLSVWVLTQQLTSIAKPFRDNVACVVAFHNPSQIGMKSLFEEFGGDLDSQTRKNLTKNLKSENYSTLCFSLRNPYHCYLRIPSPEEKARS